MDFPGSKILITGAGGFLGSHLTERAALTARHVFCVARNLPPTVKSTRPNVTYHNLDLRDPSTTLEFFESIRPDIVYHLASASGGPTSVAAVIPHLEDDIITTVSCLLAAHKVGVRRFIVPGSIDEPTVQPDMEIVPDSPYSMAKMTCITYARMFYKLYGTPVVICRIFMAYGPRQKPRKIIPYLIRSMLAHSPPTIISGSRLVDWIFISDTIEALALCGTMPNLEGKTVDVGSGKLIGIGDVAKMLQAMIPGAPSPEIGTQPPYGRTRAADLSTASRHLHWHPQTSLEDGLRATVDWYRAHGDGPT